MILLLGGTSETAAVAEALARAGRRVLVSTATNIRLNVGRHPAIARRFGRLDAAAMANLVRAKSVSAIVDVSHPYATELRATARRVAREAGIPYLTFIRPEACVAGKGVRLVASHTEAAKLACKPGRPVLLTVGSRNVAVYAPEAARRKTTLIARVLPNKASLAVCLEAGLPRDRVVVGRGPFSVKQNRSLIRRFSIGVIVTKDSGEAGGLPAKQEAARLEGCLLVVVGRASQPAKNAFSDPDALVQTVLKLPRNRVSPSMVGHNPDKVSAGGPGAPSTASARSTEPAGHPGRPSVNLCSHVPRRKKTMRKSCLVLLAHGSRNPKWCEPFGALLKHLRREAGADRVHLAHLQLAKPSLSEVVRDLASRGATAIRILPLLMSAGNHAYEDIPAEVEDLRAKHRGVRIEILPPIGSHPRFKDMMRELVRESL